MKILAFTDLHADLIPDAESRVRLLVERAKAERVDLILDLGDLCDPAEENRWILERLRSTGVPCLHCVGNHNADAAAPEEVLGFFGLERGFYSLRVGGVKWIVLDTNYIRTADGRMLPFCRRNYDRSRDEYPYLPREELDWLERELADSCSDAVVLSHQSLVNGFGNRGVANREEVRRILETHRGPGKQILFCMNGHDHGSAVEAVRGITYYTLNSVSYLWHGKGHLSYSPELHERYPLLKDILLYREPLHAVIQVGEHGEVHIQGMQGQYQTVTPRQLGLEDTWNGVSIRPETLSLTLDGCSRQ